MKNNVFVECCKNMVLLSHDNSIPLWNPMIIIPYEDDINVALLSPCPDGYDRQHL